jgi:iron-sulfur cluster assembly accessory protein
MNVEIFDIAQSIRVTQDAAEHLARQLESSGDAAVRISLKESGCNGLSYVVEGVSNLQSKDVIKNLDNGVQLGFDPEALPALTGTEIDYVREGINRTLKFNNPNIKEECGCGESFTV